MVCNKVTRSLNLLRHLSWILPQPLLLYLRSYILPFFGYCDVVWSGCTKDEALHLETLLNFACRTVLCRCRDYSASAHSELGLAALQQEENSTWPKPCSNACLPSLLLTFLNFSLPQPLTITLVPLLLANLICLLQELASGKRLSVLLVLPCGSLFQRTLELVQTLKLFQDFVSPSYREQCSLLLKTLYLLLFQLNQKYLQLHEMDNHSF